MKTFQFAEYETRHRKTHSPLRKDAVAVVDQFYKFVQ
jgi:hypothetical protein